MRCNRVLSYTAFVMVRWHMAVIALGLTACSHRTVVVDAEGGSGTSGSHGDSGDGEDTSGHGQTDVPTDGGATSTTTSTHIGPDPGTTGGETSEPLPDCPLDPAEPNDSPEAATEVPPNEHEGLLCDRRDDIDYYAVTVPAHGYIVASGEMHQPVETRLSVYDRDGLTELDGTGWPGNDWSWLHVWELTAGTYYVVVSLVSAETPGLAARYDLGIIYGRCGEVVPCFTQALEPPADQGCQIPLDEMLYEGPDTQLITADCEEVPRVDACDGSDGWTFPAIPDPPYHDYQAVELCGSWCDALHGGIELEVRFFCTP
jgi:hypothetical protein